ncbi:ribonuclease H-like domain-containing protein [Tanacetum coccineum]
MVPRIVLTRSGSISLNTARPVNTVQPRTTANNARPLKNVINNAYSTVRRRFNKITAANNSNFTKKVNTVKGTRVNTARPKAVLSAVKGNNGNAVKASTCWVWRPKHKVLNHAIPQLDLKYKGVIDSGCSRHMTGNRSYLTDYKEIDGGFVALGVPQGGLTRLFAKATPDKSNLWHKRLGHVNFKTMNKLGKPCIENLIDLRVKVIRCYNGTEFKNRVMNQFCEMKGKQSNGNADSRSTILFSPQEFPELGFKAINGEEKNDAKDPGSESGNLSKGKDSEVPSTKEPRINKEKDASVNNTNNINNVSPTVKASA